jgi:hypothetical protein
MIRKIAIIFGLGGGWLDPKGGEVYLAARCKGIGLDVGPSPFTYSDSQGVYDFLKTADWRGIVGDSFGACFGPEYAGNLAPAKVDFLAGFQPSVYSSNIQTAPDGTKFIPVPANVVTAHCVRDPDWIDTGGLGYATWIANNPKTTRLLITEHRGAHPDDTGYAQDLIFGEIKSLIGA